MAQHKNKKDKKMTKAISGAKKSAKKIVEFYYMSPKEMTAKAMAGCILSVPTERVEVWPKLNLMEVVLDNDSLIFQDGRDCFEDPLDLAFIQAHHIQSIYQMSYEEGDQEMVRRVVKEILAAMGGMICSDTDDFEPIFTLENISKLYYAE